MVNIPDSIRHHPDLWDLYTRKEEYSSRQLDQHDQFIYSYSSYQDIHSPVVSRYLIHTGFRPDYPEDKPFAVCLTHDVDEIYPPIGHLVLSSLTCCKELDLKRLWEQVSWKMNRKEKSPYLNFKEIMDIEETFEARSSFYFLATDTDITRFRYAIEDLDDELGRIVDRGWEIGLHGGYYAYNDSEKILTEKTRLEQVLGRKVVGYRNHYLRIHIPGTWEKLAQAGFLYDSSLGYNEIVGFRNGMCHPFRPFNLNTDSEVDILEIPLTIMDDTLFESTQSFEAAWDLAKRIIDTVASCQGVLCLNWHSESFRCPYKQKREIMYKKILDYCYTRNAWLTRGDSISAWWKKHEY
jgi:peptidoglycan/xylan/chitin deacetylase (PgdA/CDA1 family)